MDQQQQEHDEEVVDLDADDAWDDVFPETPITREAEREERGHRAVDEAIALLEQEIAGAQGDLTSVTRTASIRQASDLMADFGMPRAWGELLVDSTEPENGEITAEQVLTFLESLGVRIEMPEEGA
jgi:hypothetical protein